MYEEDHRELYRCPLHVHCKVEGRCDKWGFRGQEAKAEECCTLCDFCHLGKHSIQPAVLRRDKFQCVDCGKKPADNRLWRGVVTVHRLSGDCDLNKLFSRPCRGVTVHRLSVYCDEEIGPEADPAGFVTLCLDCHEKRHPERSAKCIELGGTVCLDEILASELEIAVPITSKDQLAPYKEYLLLVNQFIEHFRKNGLPPKDYRLLNFARDFPDQRLSLWLRRNAAYEAHKALTTAREMTSAPIPSLTLREKKAMRRMSEEEKMVFLRKREERHLRQGEKHLEEIIRKNAEPEIWIAMKNGHRCRVKI
jgi:hypothetical protein